MKLWFISDSHNQHELLKIPTGIDAVVHCGDESESSNVWLNEPESRKFFDWFCRLAIPTKIFVPGNHSTAIEQGLITPDTYKDVKFLIHQQIEWQGLKIFGSPYTPMFFNWSYMKPRPELEPVWQSIPDDIDILITHGPPKGILDVTKDMDTRQPVNVGSNSLTRHVTQRINPRVHAFGHIHDEPKINNFGFVKQNDIHFINCSCCNLRGQLKNHGFVVELCEHTGQVTRVSING